IARFQRYAELAPANPQALYYYAVSLWDPTRGEAANGEMDQAETLLRKALALDPKFGEAHLQLGILYSARQNHTAAVSAYRRAIESIPSLRLAHYRLGQALILLGEEALGRRELEIWNGLRSRTQEENEKAREKLFQFVYSTSPSETKHP